jgi:hypothetical protein
MWKMKSQPDARSSFRKLGLVPLLAAAALSHSAAALAQNVPIATAPLRMATLLIQGGGLLAGVAAHGKVGPPAATQPVIDDRSATSGRAGGAE